MANRNCHHIHGLVACIVPRALPQSQEARDVVQILRNPVVFEYLRAATVVMKHMPTGFHASAALRIVDQIARILLHPVVVFLQLGDVRNQRIALQGHGQVAVLGRDVLTMDRHHVFVIEAGYL